MSGETIKAFAGNASKIQFNDRAPRGVKILLYTVGGITTPGIWADGTGILGWAPMPTVDKEELAHCLDNPHSGFPPSNLPGSAMADDLFNMTPVTSSNVSRVGHNGGTTMRVEFTHGGTYDYSNVERPLFESIRDAESVGKALGVVKKSPDLYPFVKVK